MALYKDFSKYIDPNELISNNNINDIVNGAALKHNFLVSLDLGGTGDANVKAVFNEVGLLSPNDALAWNAIEVSVPGVDMAVSQSIINQRPRFFGTERGDQDLQITFVESSDMPIRRAFDKWISLMWDPYTGLRKYPDEYTVETLKVWSLSSTGHGTYFDEFQGIFPYNIADIDWNTGAFDLMTTVVKFKFRAHGLRGDESDSKFE